MDELEEFKQETRELLEEAEKALLDIENGTSFMEKYDPIFRVFHNVKGCAGMLNLEALQKHMHIVETLFQDRKGLDALTKDETGFFIKAVDAALVLLEGEETDFDYNSIGGTWSGDDSADFRDGYQVSDDGDEKPSLSGEDIGSGDSSVLIEELLKVAYRQLSYLHTRHFNQDQLKEIQDQILSIQQQVKQVNL